MCNAKRKKGADHQPSLFPTESSVYGEIDAPIRAHAADPLTSHLAAERVSKGGRRKRNREIVAAMVTEMAGATGHELWSGAAESQRLELGDYVELYRILADLKNRNLLRQGDSRLCTVRKVQMITWYPIE